MTIEIDENSRTVIAGQTGSGKTYLAKELLKNQPRLVVFDPKGNLAEDMQLEKGTRKNWRKLLRGFDMRLQVTLPENIDSKSIPEHLERYFGMAFEASNLVVYVDELYDVTQGSNNILPNFRKLYTRGREPIYSSDGKIKSGNIGVVACVQRPSRIPMFALTECQNLFIFRLQDPDDRIRCAEYTSQIVRKPIPDPHGFFYFQVGMTKAEYHKEL